MSNSSDAQVIISKESNWGDLNHNDIDFILQHCDNWIGNEINFNDPSITLDGMCSLFRLLRNLCSKPQVQSLILQKQWMIKLLSDQSKAILSNSTLKRL